MRLSMIMYLFNLSQSLKIEKTENIKMKHGLTKSILLLNISVCLPNKVRIQIG